jgi:hypothetical protein
VRKKGEWQANLPRGMLRGHDPDDSALYRD